MVIITDGDPTNYYNAMNTHIDCNPLYPGDPPAYNACKKESRIAAADEAELARNDGVEIFVLGVGIGPSSGMSTASTVAFLRSEIASSPSHYASVDDFDELADAIEDLCPI
jgi:hypothetical protein